MKVRWGFLICWVILMATIIFFTVRPPALRAQAITAATPMSFTSTGTLANCPPVTASAAQWCYTTTGLYQSLNGSAWTLLGGAPTPPAVTITLNGVTKTLPATFTVSTPTTITAQ
jgi:hypothetical protein